MEEKEKGGGIGKKGRRIEETNTRRTRKGKEVTRRKNEREEIKEREEKGKGGGQGGVEEAGEIGWREREVKN